MILHNAYKAYSGEEVTVEKQVRLLRHGGHEVIPYWRSSAELSQLRLGRLRAFAAGIFAPRSRREIRRLLTQYSPTVVHVHNLFPLISPSVLPEVRRQGVPVVMTVHNYRLACPNGLHMSKRTLLVCERCRGGKVYWCVLTNCEADVCKSIGYALRNWVARAFSLFLRNVAIYMCVTHFQRQRLIEEGFPAERIVVLANMVEDPGMAPDVNTAGTYVGYLGRVSPEKGIDTLLAAAGKLPHIPFQVAGSYDSTSPLLHHVPRNLQLLGFLNQQAAHSFLLGTRLVVLCSTWFEGCPTVVVEAMMAGKAVVASRIGGIPEIVDDNVTGLLVCPGDAQDFAEKIRYLWDRPRLCRQMGQAGREKALREYSSQRYYERLMAVYEMAVAVGPPGRSSGDGRSGQTECPRQGD
jgi:glycosyltransferase involved in cell wall biosynthesis